MRKRESSALKSWIAVLAILVALGVPAGAGVAVFVDPVVALRTPEWISVASLESLPAAGIPLQVRVKVPQSDAWSTLPDAEIGSVFLIRSPQEGGIRAFQGTYHCGAAIAYDEPAKQFVVPCWVGIRFTTDGRRVHTVQEWGDLPAVQTRIVNGAVLVNRADVIASEH